MTNSTECEAATGARPTACRISYCKKEPFRSVPILAKTSSELACDAVNENPSSFDPEKEPTAVASRNSAAKLVGSAGSKEPGVKCVILPEEVHVTSKLTVALA